MKARHFLSRSSRYVESPALLPPKVSELGHQGFTSLEHAVLADWLREPAWPRETLDIHGLEGYLVALLVWPVELQPGAWLPPIWNQGGWKIPPPIESTQRYRDFLELVLGYLRALDEGLLGTPPVLCTRLCLPFRKPPSATLECVQRWARGFGRGLQQAAQARAIPDLDTRKAVRAIAVYTEGHPSDMKGDVQAAHDKVIQAALMLAAKRPSRGPLGHFLKQAATAAKASRQ